MATSSRAALLDRLREHAEELPAAAVDGLARAIERGPAGAWDRIRAGWPAAAAPAPPRAGGGADSRLGGEQAADLAPASVSGARCGGPRGRGGAGRAGRSSWSGPAPTARRSRSADRPVAAPAHRRRVAELPIVTFAVYKVPAIAAAIIRVARRGVAVRIVVELPDASEGKVAYDALAALGPDVATRARIFRWPLDRRPTDRPAASTARSTSSASWPTGARCWCRAPT